MESSSNRSSSIQRRLAVGVCVFFAGSGGRCHAFVPIQHQLLQVRKPINLFDHLNLKHGRYFMHASVHNGRQLTMCHETRGVFDRGEGSADSSKVGLEDSLRSILPLATTGSSTTTSTTILLAPAAMALLAFSTYSQVATGFHNFVDVASGHTWAAVDGGSYLADLITPALTGPVASFISLLFGTLTSMTVGELYSRQSTIARLLAELLADMRLAEVHISKLPTDEYRQQGKKLMRIYGALLVAILQDDNITKQEVQHGREAGRRILEQMMELLHRVAEDKSVADQLNSRALDEAYATVNRLIRTRTSLVTTYENSFPVWHYGNLCILAMAILFIFLVLTDKTALLFLGGFQLRLCWSMLIGTLSMLVAVIIDLDSPLSGPFQVVMPAEFNETELDEYVETFSEKATSIQTIDE